MKRFAYITWVVSFILFSQLNAEVYSDKFFIEPMPDEIKAEKITNKLDTAVDYVVVRKKQRKLILYDGAEQVKSYNIALGKQPEGHKQKEGDSKTPEGLYILDWRNPHSKFYRSIHVSYPNLTEAKAAKEAGIDPGGAIMIHGQPNDWSERIKLTFANRDWTEGCIALENQDMLEVWDLVKDGTPIEIKP